MYFIGTYYCKADAKGRVKLPVMLLKHMEPIRDQGFVIKRSMYSECLELFPLEEWKKVNAELNTKSRYDSDSLDFIRKYTAGLRPVEIDGSGRLLINGDLMASVGITKDVVLATINNNLEIWDRALYEEAINAPMEQKKALSRKVMGSEKPRTDVS